MRHPKGVRQDVCVSAQAIQSGSGLLSPPFGAPGNCRTQPGDALQTLALVFATALCFGEVPDVAWMLPAGSQPGQSATLSIGGKTKPWDKAKIWFSHPGIVGKADTDNKVAVLVAKDVPPGIYAFRLFNEKGASPPRPFVISPNDAGPERLEKEPNSKAENATAITALPAIANGKLYPSGDIDSFKVTLKAGQTLWARVACHVLDGPVDPLLHVATLEGGELRELAFEHDGDGLDPWLAFTAERAGDYLLRLSGFQHPPASRHTFAGKAEAVYRMALSTEEPAMPAAKERRGDQKLVEGAVNGVLEREQGQDFSFAAKKGDLWRFRVRAAEYRLPLDMVLRVAAADGKGKPTEADDVHKNRPDPLLDWSTPADGDYTLTVFERTGRSASNLVYRLEAERRPPGWTAHTEQHALTLKAGGSVKLKVKAKRDKGFTDLTHLLVLDLPDGVEASSPKIPAKDGEVEIELKAGEKAKPWQGPVRIVALTPETEEVRRQPVQVRLKGRTTAFENLALQEVPSLWLTLK